MAYYDRKPKRVDAVKSSEDAYIVHDIEANVTTTMSKAEFEVDYIPVTPRPRARVGQVLVGLKDKVKDKVEGKAAA